MNRFINKSRTLGKPKDLNSGLEEQQATTKGLLRCLQGTCRLLHTRREAWGRYCPQTVLLAGLGLAFLYMTCTTPGYAYTQGIGGSLLSILTALSAVSGLIGASLFTFQKHYGLVTTGIISSWLHVGSLRVPRVFYLCSRKSFEYGYLLPPIKQEFLFKSLDAKG